MVIIIFLYICLSFSLLIFMKLKSKYTIGHLEINNGFNHLWKFAFYRLDCMSKYSGGLFRRTESKKSDLVLPFSTEIRRQMDELIRHVDVKVLQPRGYPPMPLSKYKFFEKASFGTFRHNLT